MTGQAHSLVDPTREEVVCANLTQAIYMVLKTLGRKLPGAAAATEQKRVRASASPLRWR